MCRTRMRSFAEYNPDGAENRLRYLWLTSNMAAQISSMRVSADTHPTLDTWAFDLRHVFATLGSLALNPDSDDYAILRGLATNPIPLIPSPNELRYFFSDSEADESVVVEFTLRRAGESQ